MLRVGLTGGIACGKSEVVRRLSAAGLPTLDLDRVAHELMAPGQPGTAAVVEAFGPAVLAHDGAIDRRALGALVFADGGARQRLNGILHPRIRAEEDRRAQSLGARPGSLLITDAALLVETGSHLRFDRLVVVHCRPEQQVARLRARDGLTEQAAQARLAAQMPIATKVRFAHVAIDASGTIEATRSAADALAGELEGLARHRPAPLVVAEARARGVLLHGPAAGPRGLRPARVAQRIAAAGGIELESLAAELRPKAEGPWYAAADVPFEGETGDDSGAAPAALMGPLVLHELRGTASTPSGSRRRPIRWPGSPRAAQARSRQLCSTPCFWPRCSCSAAYPPTSRRAPWASSRWCVAGPGSGPDVIVGVVVAGGSRSP